MGQRAVVEYTVTEKGRRAPQYTLDSDVNGAVTLQDFLQYTKNIIIAVARDALKDEQSRGFDQTPVVKVDNKFNAPIESVNPFGQIEFIARASVKELLLFSYESIIGRSRVATGRYLKSNIVSFNGEEIARDMKEFQSWLENKKSFKDTDRIRFVNIAPYANKLELDGLAKGSASPKSRQVKPRGGGNKVTVRKPNGTYSLALRAIRNKYKSNSLIKYELVLGSELGLTSPERGSGVGRIRQTGRSKGRTYVYPSILIYLFESGITQ